MMATGYTIAGILIGTTVLVAGGILAGLGFAGHATPPVLLERRRRRDRR
jgi:hypothetical protein